MFTSPPLNCPNDRVIALQQQASHPTRSIHLIGENQRRLALIDPERYVFSELLKRSGVQSGSDCAIETDFAGGTLASTRVASLAQGTLHNHRTEAIASRKQSS